MPDKSKIGLYIFVISQMVLLAWLIAYFIRSKNAEEQEIPFKVSP